MALKCTVFESGKPPATCVNYYRSEPLALAYLGERYGKRVKKEKGKRAGIWTFESGAKVAVQGVIGSY